MLRTKFTLQLTNYLNDNLAKLIKKEAKNESVITNAVSNLYTADAENKATIVKAKTEAEKTKLLTEVETKKIKADAQVQQAEADAQIAEAQAKTIESKAKAAEIKSEAMKKLVEANKSKLSKQCNDDADALTLDGNFTKNLANLMVCISDEGKISSGECKDAGSSLLCVDDVGLNTSTITEGRVASVKWKLSQNVTSSGGSLAPGFYKVVVAGGAGSSGSRVDVALSHCSGGSGGNGDVQERVFGLDASKSFTSQAGRPSKFTIQGVVDITAAGGGDGSSAHKKVFGCDSGSRGADAGNGKNPLPGYVQIWVPDL